MSSKNQSLILQWQCDKSLSLVTASDVLGLKEKLLPGDKVTARYNSRLLPAVILYIGGKEEMQQKMNDIQPDPSDSTDSPKGRGHRTLKRKQLPNDFVTGDDDIMLPPKKAHVSTSQLQKQAKSAAGHDIIQQLLEQRTEINIADHPEDNENDEDISSEDSEVTEIPNSEEHELQQQLEKLKGELQAAHKKIEQLEKLNQCVLKGLPDIVRQLQLLFEKNRDVSTTLSKQKPVPSTPFRSKGHSFSSSSPLEFDATKPEGCHTNGKSEPDEVTEVKSEILDSALISRAMAGKTVGKVICNLMRCMFTREEMAMASVTGKSSGNEVRTKLDDAKVEEVIRLTMTKFIGAERANIRAKMAEKLKDERKAFHSK